MLEGTVITRGFLEKGELEKLSLKLIMPIIKPRRNRERKGLENERGGEGKNSNSSRRSRCARVLINWFDAWVGRR